MTCRVINLRQLAAGGNGDLFLGQRDDTGQYVVVKYLREFRLAEARRVFAREVRIGQRRLRHVVQVLFADTEGERPYYVMPYLPGGAVAKYAGQLTDAQLRTVAWEVAVALAGLHAVWVSHGDIKPDNVLLSQDGHLHVGDPLGNGLGCTVLFSENRGGTPGYWAPEVRAGAPISRAGDVYSYGATLRHLLTGSRPEDGQRLAEGLAAWAGSSPKIRETIAACCQPDPRERPTMPEVLRMLRGERWGDIQVERRQRREAVKAACVVGGVILGVGLLARALSSAPGAGH